MAGYRSQTFPKLHLPRIIARAAIHHDSGCIQIANASHVWMLYLERAKLIYASSSLDPFGRLDRYLQRLSLQRPELSSPIRVQVRLLYEQDGAMAADRCSDYEAISWLVEQHYMTPAQAADVIEAMAQDVLATLLPLQVGRHEFYQGLPLVEQPRYCHLDLRHLVESYQRQKLRQRATSASRLDSVDTSHDRPRSPHPQAIPISAMSSLPSRVAASAPQAAVMSPATHSDSLAAQNLHAGLH